MMFGSRLSFVGLLAGGAIGFGLPLLWLSRVQQKRLAAFEEQFNQYKSGNMGDIPPEVLDELKNYTQFWDSGKREVFQVV